MGDIEIYLAGVIDPAKERGAPGVPAQEARSRTSGKIEARLGNEGFVGRAPADVVDKEKQKLADLTAEIELIDANLKAL